MVFFSRLYACLISVNSLTNPLIYCIRLRQFRVAFIQLLFKKSLAQAEEYEKKVFGWTNATVASETNQGGETEEQTTNQANAINDMETNQRGEREEQYVSQTNTNNKIGTNRGGEREERYVSQANALSNMETYQGGEREEQYVCQANALMDMETNHGGEREEQYVCQANAVIDMDRNQGGEERGAICQPSQCLHRHGSKPGRGERGASNMSAKSTPTLSSGMETNQGGERDEKKSNKANPINDKESTQGGKGRAICQSSQHQPRHRRKPGRGDKGTTTTLEQILTEKR